MNNASPQHRSLCYARQKAETQSRCILGSILQTVYELIIEIFVKKIFSLRFSLKCFNQFRVRSLFLMTYNMCLQDLDYELINCFEIDPSKQSASYVRHYDDVIMGAMASQITSLTIAYSTVYSDADQRKHQSSASLAFVRGTHRGPVNSPHKWPVKRKIFDDVIMSFLTRQPIRLIFWLEKRTISLKIATNVTLLRTTSVYSVIHIISTLLAKSNGRFFFRIIFPTSVTLRSTIFCSNKLDFLYFRFINNNIVRVV